ncbi:cerebellin-4-like [Mytilus trossulus]|uniref:cerebellin-4-like n=1 Tax=Mytilus trossulus TaxID=6551 RepID=UPI003007B43C
MSLRKGMFALSIQVFVAVMCSSMSIQNQNFTVDETQDERIEHMENVIKTLESKIEILNSTMTKGSDQSAVMFYALIKSASTIYLSAKSTVVFESVMLNIGSNYNSNDGVFVAPRKGVYLFSWTVSSTASKYILTQLVVQNRIISNAGETDTDPFYHSASMTALCRMQKDDHAFIRTTAYGGENAIYSYDQRPRSSFLGMLVHNEN